MQSERVNVIQDSILNIAIEVQAAVFTDRVST
jgi:hypothetical protein